MYDGTSALTFHPPIKAPLPRPAPRPARRTSLPEQLPHSPPKTEALPGHSQRSAAIAPSRKAAANPAMKLPFRTVALFAGAMAVLLFIVYSYMQLSQLSNANQNAAKELQLLRREEGVLNRRAEASVSLSEVEAYAVGELGMVKPTREQIIYIGAVAQDRAEIIPQKGFWGSVRQLFSTMTTHVIEFIE
ncbi:MAG: hypothetical protein LBI19_00520 [Oscillospiraceae bacterium]|jgi:hypothetical protein|nr:hypothetical protein [Oscillospiraceae bacterium]